LRSNTFNESSVGQRACQSPIVQATFWPHANQRNARNDNPGTAAIELYLLARHQMAGKITIMLEGTGRSLLRLKYVNIGAARQSSVVSLLFDSQNNGCRRSLIRKARMARRSRFSESRCHSCNISGEIRQVLSRRRAEARVLRGRAHGCSGRWGLGRLAGQALSISANTRRSRCLRHRALHQ